MISTNKILNARPGFLGSTHITSTVCLVVSPQHYLFVSNTNNQIVCLNDAQHIHIINEKFNHLYDLTSTGSVLHAWSLNINSNQQHVYLSDLPHNLWYSTLRVTNNES